VRFLIMTNELPAIADSSGTIASRFILLKLTESFYGKEDVDLKDKLRPELAGVLNWALEGLDRLRRRGHFEQPASSKESIRMLEDLASPEAAFVRDWCWVGPDEDENVKTLYAAYRVWAKDAGHRPRENSVFGRSLRAVVPALRTKGAGIARQYLGVGLSEDGQFQFDNLRNEERAARSR
jgi:putative DNA primase/helicase